MKVLIIDYGMGNVCSVKRALEECGAMEVTISKEREDFDDCTHAILPGVGAFPDAMANIRKLGLDQLIQKLAIEDNVPLLGICLGMQLLATKGQEVQETAGLGLIPGVVKPLVPLEGERVPHVGWNQASIKKASVCFENIKDGADFYFVHSFHFVPDDENSIVASTPYCGNFAAAIGYKNITGVQFHPEKSSVTGFQLLKNFLNS